MKKNIRSIGYATLANAIILLVSVIATIIVPRFMSNSYYGYWQLYVFYISYIGFFNLGLQDGFYLKYGGKEYQELNKPLFHSELVLLFSFEIIIAFLIFIIADLFVLDINKVMVMKWFGVCCVVYLPSAMLQYILLMTNRIAEYSATLIIEKGSYGVLIIALLIGKVYEYKFFIIADILGKALALIYVAFRCRDIISAQFSPFKKVIYEVFDNCKAGIVLLLANIASLLLVGVVRFFIEIEWSIEVFAKISLTISLCNFALTFLTAIGQVIFPILKRTEEKKLPQIYKLVSSGLVVAVLAVLIFYYPLSLLVKMWLPNYTESVKYLAFVLPICVYESKMNLLINTYYKVLRKEKLLLALNIPAVILSLVLGYCAVFVLQSIQLALLSIVVVCAFRCIITERWLIKTLGIVGNKEMIIELVLPLLFVIFNYLFSPACAWGIYCLVYIMCSLIFMRKEVLIALKCFKKIS